MRTDVDRVVTAVWGLPSGLADQPGGAAAMHGWKTQWQVTYSDFDAQYAERYGSMPPEHTNPMQLGMVGVGRALRKALVVHASAPTITPTAAEQVQGVVASLNNVIGWMRMDDGVTKAERQPRVDLTYQWHAPSAFWNTSADTGWIFEVQAQALNILKTSYDSLDEARPHLEGLVELVMKSRRGLDANGDGTIAPAMMEGGLMTMLAQARTAGLY